MALQPQPFVRWTRAATVKRPIVGDLNWGWLSPFIQGNVRNELMSSLSSVKFLRSTDLYSVWDVTNTYIYIFIHTHCTVLTTVNWWNQATCLNLYTLPCLRFWNANLIHQYHQSSEANSLRKNWSDVQKVKILARRGEVLERPEATPPVRMTSGVKNVYLSFPEVPEIGAMQCCCYWGQVLYDSNSQYHHYQCQKTSVLHFQLFSYSHPDK